MPEIDPETLKRLAFEAHDARVKATANSLILVEIVRELAKASDDPDGFAAELFLRIRSRLSESEENPLIAHDGSASRGWAAIVGGTDRRGLTVLAEGAGLALLRHDAQSGARWPIITNRPVQPNEFVRVHRYETT